MENRSQGSGLFGGAEAARFVAELTADDRSAASSRITQALRTVLEAGDDLDAAEAESGLAAVAVLVAEEDPSVLDNAPDSTALRTRLADLDTELTPARRTAAQGVITRALVPEANSWLAARSAQDDWAGVLADIERLGERLADG